MQINLSSAFVRVNLLIIFYKLCSVGIRGSLLCVFSVFLLSVTESCGGWLSEQCGNRGVRSASGKYFGPVVVPPVHHGAFHDARELLENY